MGIIGEKRDRSAKEGVWYRWRLKQGASEEGLGLMLINDLTELGVVHTCRSGWPHWLRRVEQNE